ncbi:MAG: ABC transporter ATP-binding protein [Bacteroidetes bacterium]|nr:ABC transporter ATP-binding protein [Bacteroidota bacterium]MCW5897399.1 ABC transporter ATP-binding protein [Bacteroidota bacterium]
MSRISLHNISRQFDDTLAVHDVSLEIASGEFFSILGPSGCGKTTLLRMIAGFERPTSGTISFDASDVTHVPTQYRGVGMVFQNYALFPHMTVFENVAFGLETKRMERRAIRKRVEEILDSVHLSGKIDVPVPLLSGGEQQRVAVARAVVVEPAVLLMDEPLSNLDVALRLKTREEIRLLQKKTGITTVYVTHDQSEAMSLSDRIAVMRSGTIEQVGAPAQMYEAPVSAFVAEFLGGANVLPATVSRSELTITAGKLVLHVPATFLDRYGDGDARLVVRPEAIVLLPSVGEGDNAALIVHKEYLGFTTNFFAQVGEVTLRITSMTSGLTKRLRSGDVAGIRFDLSRCTVLPHD